MKKNDNKNELANSVLCFIDIMSEFINKNVQEMNITGTIKSDKQPFQTNYKFKINTLDKNTLNASIPKLIENGDDKNDKIR